MESTNIHTPSPGLPVPNKPKRSTQANILMSITFLIPKRFKKKGISRMQSVSDICDKDIKILACSTPKVPL